MIVTRRDIETLAKRHMTDPRLDGLDDRAAKMVVLAA